MSRGSACCVDGTRGAAFYPDFAAFERSEKGFRRVFAEAKRGLS